MDVAQFKVCVTCTATLDRDQVPSLSSSNSFMNPHYPAHLPSLDCTSERLVTLRLPFMQIRRLRHQIGEYGIVGQVINVLVVVNMVTTHRFNVHLNRNFIHMSVYLQGCI
jgi:hypothetical protein